MSVLATAGRNAAMDAVNALLDGGKLIWKKADHTVVGTFTLPDPAFGGAVAGVATAEDIDEVLAVADGPIAEFTATQSDDTLVESGTLGIKYAVAALNQGNKTFQINGVDLTSVLTNGVTVRVTDSTGNDGTYTVHSSSFSTNTTVTVEEAIPNATADGYFHPYGFTVVTTTVVTGQPLRVDSGQWTRTQLPGKA